MNKYSILSDWACELVRLNKKDISDEQYRDKIRDRLKCCEDMSYREIALTAVKVGRRNLASMLLEFEPKAKDQIPLLLDMEEDQLALRKAVQSGDSDLILQVVLELKDRMLGTGESENEFFRLLYAFPRACNLLLKYCQTQPELQTQILFGMHKYINI